jgi:predicted house-cleaning noncanonical NTP pyrophosphatase (MazG superfamily)
MIMVLNDVLTKQNVITKLLLKDGDKELPKALKVKIMRMRMAYNKIKQQFDSDVQEFTKELVPEELQTLANKEDRTEEENARFEELNNKVNSEYQEFLIQKGLEEIADVIDDSFTMDEYSDIVDVNSGNDVEINGNKIKAADFLEIIYDLFVKE